MMNRYEKYKDSGIPWIGQIPEHWEVRRLKNIGSAQNGLTYSPIDVCDENQGVLVLRSSNIQDGKLAFDDNVYVSVNKVSNNLLVCKGDIIICSRNGSASLVGKSALVTDDISACFGAFMMRFRSNEDYRYTYNLLTAAITQYKQLFSTSTINQLTIGIFYGLAMPFTRNKEEQQAIADFLDVKCAEVDELIALQGKMIDELKVYKQSVITEAVTKGLNPDALLRDSGIEWIGQIPEHWELIKIKTIFNLVTGTTPSNFEINNNDESQINWFTPVDINDMGCELFDSQRKLSARVIKENNIKLFPINSLIYVGIGATAGKLGFSHVESYSNQQITAFISKSENINKFYYYYLLINSKRIRDNAFYTTLPILNNSYLNQVVTIKPSLSEQVAITDFLDVKCAEIDEMTSIKQKKIDQLKEYKKSIIYEYVTGKKQVNIE